MKATLLALALALLIGLAAADTAEGEDLQKRGVIVDTVKSIFGGDKTTEEVGGDDEYTVQEGEEHDAGALEEGEFENEEIDIDTSDEWDTQEDEFVDDFDFGDWEFGDEELEDEIAAKRKKRDLIQTVKDWFGGSKDETAGGDDEYTVQEGEEEDTGALVEGGEENEEIDIDTSDEWDTQEDEYIDDFIEGDWDVTDAIVAKKRKTRDLGEAISNLFGGNKDETVEDYTVQEGEEEDTGALEEGDFEDEEMDIETSEFETHEDEFVDDFEFKDWEYGEEELEEEIAA